MLDRACGCRVGGEAPSSPPGDRELRFIADAMLERLARWLRALGFDTVSGGATANGELVRRAMEEGRYLLTRDRRLPDRWRGSGCLLLRSTAPLEQLREVITHFQLTLPPELFTRCLVCNTELRSANAEEIASQVPQGAHARLAASRYCPSCGRVYWEGSHTRRMRSTLAGIIGRPAT
jgi:uncharacterized protein